MRGFGAAWFFGPLGCSGRLVVPGARLFGSAVSRAGRVEPCRLWRVALCGSAPLCRAESAVVYVRFVLDAPIMSPVAGCPVRFLLRRAGAVVL